MSAASPRSDAQRNRMASSLRPRKAAAAAAPAAPAEVEHAPTAPRPTAAPRRGTVRTEPVRVTVDLAPALHRTLKMHALTGDVRIVEIVRAAVMVMSEDDAVREQILGRAAELAADR